MPPLFSVGNSVTSSGTYSFRSLQLKKKPPQSWDTSESTCWLPTSGISVSGSERLAMRRTRCGVQVLLPPPADSVPTFVQAQSKNDARAVQASSLAIDLLIPTKYGLASEKPRGQSGRAQVPSNASIRAG